jgi:hypothetical protein
MLEGKDVFTIIIYFQATFSYMLKKYLKEPAFTKYLHLEVDKAFDF